MADSHPGAVSLDMGQPPRQPAGNHPVLIGRDLSSRRSPAADEMALQLLRVGSFHLITRCTMHVIVDHTKVPGGAIDGLGSGGPPESFIAASLMTVHELDNCFVLR